MINFITVCTDDYPMLYAEKLNKKLRSVSKLQANYFCITDRPHEVGSWAQPIIPTIKSKGWWNKVNLFGPDMPDGWLVYLDIDIVIQRNFDKELAHLISMDFDVSCVSDAITWMGERFNSSFLLMKSKSNLHIFREFECMHQELLERPGGDQVWIGPKLQKINYIDETFPNFKRSLKFDLAKKSSNLITLPEKIDKEIKLVDCSGRPKPHELSNIPYIRNNWHSVL